MTMLVVLYALIALGYALYLTNAIQLVRIYRRTHDIGYIWLGAAVLVWPLAARLLGVVADRGGVGPFPINLLRFFETVWRRDRPDRELTERQ